VGRKGDGRERKRFTFKASQGERVFKIPNPVITDHRQTKINLA
jgi:hypothetical protein